MEKKAAEARDFSRMYQNPAIDAAIPLIEPLPVAPRDHAGHRGRGQPQAVARERGDGRRARMGAREIVRIDPRGWHACPPRGHQTETGAEPRMRVRSIFPLLWLTAAACSAHPSDAGLCTFAAQVNGTLYVLSTTVAAERAGAEVARTVRQRDCVDGRNDPVSWDDGDSSFAPNTPLYAELGRPPGEVLIAPLPDGRWLELRRR